MPPRATQRSGSPLPQLGSASTSVSLFHCRGPHVEPPQPDPPQNREAISPKYHRNDLFHCLSNTLRTGRLAI
eukprot:1187338-Amphidinium_carterae.1